MSGDESFNISIEQAKLLGHSLRVRIIKQLLHTPRTAKQVADMLGESGGNVHYHMMKLYEGGLIKMVEEKKVGGVTEKYYLSRSKWFNTIGSGAVDPVLADEFDSSNVTKLILRLDLTNDQKDELHEEFKQLLERWVDKTSMHMTDNAITISQEYSVGIQIKSTKEKKETGDNTEV